MEDVFVAVAEASAEPGVAVADLLLGGRGDVAEDGSEDEGEEECSEESESVGDGHGGEDLSGDALHGEERDEGDEDDGGGEEDRARGVGDAFDDEVAGFFTGDSAGELSIDALEHDDGGVDEDAEVDGTDGDEVGGAACQHHHAEGEEDGEGNRDCGDEGDAEVAEHRQQHERDEDEAGDDDFADGVGGAVDERRAVVDGADVHAGRKEAAGVEAGDLFLEGFECGKGFFFLLEEDDAEDDVVLLVAAYLAEAWLEAFGNCADVAHGDGCAVLFGDDDGADVVGVVDLAEGADVDVLVAELEVVAAGVGVGGLDGVEDLREGDAVAEELVGIGLDLILARGAAEGGDVDDAGDLFEFAAN